MKTLWTVCTLVAAGAVCSFCVGGHCADAQDTQADTAFLTHTDNAIDAYREGYYAASADILSGILDTCNDNNRYFEAMLQYPSELFELMLRNDKVKEEAVEFLRRAKIGEVALRDDGQYMASLVRNYLATGDERYEKRLEAFGEHSVPYVLGELRHMVNVKQRTNLILLLETLAPEGHRALIAALDDPDPAMQSAVIYVLGRVKQTEAVMKLYELYINTDLPQYVRKAAGDNILLISGVKTINQPLIASTYALVIDTLMTTEPTPLERIEPYGYLWRWSEVKQTLEKTPIPIDVCRFEAAKHCCFEALDRVQPKEQFLQALCAACLEENVRINTIAAARTSDDDGKTSGLAEEITVPYCITRNDFIRPIDMFAAALTDTINANRSAHFEDIVTRNDRYIDALGITYLAQCASTYCAGKHYRKLAYTLEKIRKIGIHSAVEKTSPVLQCLDADDDYVKFLASEIAAYQDPTLRFEGASRVLETLAKTMCGVMNTGKGVEFRAMIALEQITPEAYTLAVVVLEPYLAAGLNASNISIRTHTYKLIQQFGSVSLADALVDKIIDTDEDPGIRNIAIETLGVVLAKNRAQLGEDNYAKLLRCYAAEGEAMRKTLISLFGMSRLNAQDMQKLLLLIQDDSSAP